MKKLTLTFTFLFSIGIINSQSLIGAWETTFKDENEKSIKITVLFTEKHQVATWYDAESGAFQNTNGGSWTIDGNTVTEVVEFDTKNPDRVGTKAVFEVDISENSLNIVGDKMTWTRVDNGTPGDLHGAWLMSGRKRDGEIQTRDTNRPRKTMKILSGTRFQWIAYNTETKEFMGTGGGTYTTQNGKYTENIDFFSRDNSRVGASLEFDYELKDGYWHHSGFSSKGTPLYEIWSKRE